MTLLIIGVAALSVAATLWSEARRPSLEWLFKPLASLCFIALALHSGALAGGYGRWLLAGLVLCMAGDVFLISHHRRAFLAGLGSFLAGHLLYIVAFGQLPIAATASLWGLPAVLVLTLFSLRWLWPHLSGTMQLPVLAYIAAISAMLLVAAGCWGTAAGPWILAGAWAFAISDLAVARNQFVRRSMANRCWGLPLYYAGQLILAATPGLL